MVVLDASALLALLFKEPGHDVVAQHMESACISTINMAEVIGRFTRDGHSALATWHRISGLPVEVLPFTMEEAILTASLLPKTREAGLSIADRACLAVSILRGLPVLTADAAWTQYSVGARVQLIR